MKIGIIGAGHIGGTLAKRLTALGHQVEIANSRGPDSLRDIEADSGAKAVTTEQAVRGKDLIVLTIPMKAVPGLPKGLFRDVPASVPVVDTCNYYPRERDGRIAPIEDGMAESRWVSEQIGRPTVKAFNNIFAKRLAEGGKPKGAVGRLALPVSGDDPAQRAKVMAVIDELGFDPFDNGRLDESFRYQPGQPGYTSDFDVAGLKEKLAAANPERQPKFTAGA